MLNCLRGDGAYPLEYGKGWERLMVLSEEVATKLLNDNTVTNKEFYIIPRWEGDYDYIKWNDDGREKKLWDKKYYTGATAVYKHDFTWWLIRKSN